METEEFETVIDGEKYIFIVHLWVNWNARAYKNKKLINIAKAQTAEKAILSLVKIIENGK